MHQVTIPAHIVDRVRKVRGGDHIYSSLDMSKASAAVKRSTKAPTRTLFDRVSISCSYRARVLWFPLAAARPRGPLK